MNTKGPKTIWKITRYRDQIPCDDPQYCKHVQCDLWVYRQWKVSLRKFLGIKYLYWTKEV